MNKDVTMKILKFIAFTILILISTSNIYALDTRGKDFWFNYMPNFHTNGTERTDSLLIFMAAEDVTNCTIEYTNAAGLKFSSKITITNPKQVYTFKVYWKNFELIGFNNLQDISEFNQCEEVAKQSFHIVSDNNISVIAHSKARLTNDAFLVFPTTALGKEYYILSYNSDGDKGFGNSISETSTPSQFSITAVEDNTYIEIFPKVATAKYGNSKQTLNLNKGESYLVQARITANNLNGDLTGSYIKSDKPIAVFGGQQRASLPVNSGNPQASRDIVVEQMVPINFWGRNAYIVPFQPIKLITSYGTDLYRIIAAFDSTEVYMNGDLVTMLNAGEYFEGVLDQIYQVESSGPILVAEYKKSSGDGNSNVYEDGDPFMVLVPPKEQFSRIYRCINAQVYDGNFNGGGNVEVAFREQYVTLVAPDLALSSVKIDGIPVQLNQFQKIYKSGYSVVTAKVKDGTHDITCDEEVGIFIYGYGPANSYGYIGGMSSKNIDFNPPVAEIKKDCDGFSIFSLDTNIYDSGIDSILTPSNLNNNIVFNIPTHSDTVNFRFTAKVIDKYQDAKMTVIIKDSIGYSKKIIREIKGFTVGIKNLTDTLQILDSLSSKAIKCYDIELFNYGKFIQTFDLKFALGNTKMTLSDNGKITIAPGKSKIVQVCYNSLSNPNVIDSLLVVDSCASRMLATFNLISVPDTTTPSILVFNDPCANSYKVNFVDSTRFDSGIKSVKLISENNCKVNFDLASTNLYKVSINVINPVENAFYSISVVDFWGNSKTMTDTIYGFSLAYELFNSDTSNALNFKDKVIGGVYCDSIKLTNLSNSDLKLDSAKMLHNIEFSVPQSQFPLFIKSKESIILDVCYHPTRYVKNKVNTDSLILELNCRSRVIKMQGKTLEFTMEGSNKCGQISKISSSYVPNSFGFNSLSPNPSSGIININFESNKSENLTFEIYDVLGNNKLNSNIKVNESGVFEVEIDASELKNGTYYCLLNNGKQCLIQKLIISK
jgi:hypothetical protein